MIVAADARLNSTFSSVVGTIFFAVTYRIQFWVALMLRKNSFLLALEPAHRERATQFQFSHLIIQVQFSISPPRFSKLRVGLSLDSEKSAYRKMPVLLLFGRFFEVISENLAHTPSLKCDAIIWPQNGLRRGSHLRRKKKNPIFYEFSKRRKRATKKY